MEFLKVLELYSGIGGMHCALKEADINAKVVTAIDINPKANYVYKYNFPDVTLLEKNIQSLREHDIDNMGVNMIMMSPPCQPFTRNGLRKDTADNRNLSIMHIIDIIQKLKTVQYILLENVYGFENSEIRNKLINSLTESNFTFQEFLLTPSQFKIPNSRLRYYLLAKKSSMEFCFSKRSEIMMELPPLPDSIVDRIEKINSKYGSTATADPCFELDIFLSDNEGDLIPDGILGKYGSLFDIVTRKSRRSCCFTKSYTSYVEGTGSVFTPQNPEFVEVVFQKLKEIDKGTEEYVDTMKLLKLRYFSPNEVSKLMSFPNYFQFPNDLQKKYKYKLLGNSINVHVVAILTLILVS